MHEKKRPAAGKTRSWEENSKVIANNGVSGSNRSSEGRSGRDGRELIRQRDKGLKTPGSERIRCN